MKAAVVYHRGEMPQCADIPEPFVRNEDELLITVKAAAIKHFDKRRAGGKHYSAENLKQNATVIAERAVIEKRRMVKLPKGIDDATAAALPNAIAGSAMALRFRAAMKPGETLLINGITI
jgi:NADPH:quinone reductase-like Zn-dependent oxidoreductase